MLGRNNKNLKATVQVLEKLGGQAHVSKIYKGVRELRRALGDDPPESIDMIVQGTLETFCSDSDKYQAGNYDLFRMVYGKGQGVYRLNLTGLDQYKDDIRVPTAEEL